MVLIKFHTANTYGLNYTINMRNKESQGDLNVATYIQKYQHHYRDFIGAFFIADASSR